MNRKHLRSILLSLITLVMLLVLDNAVRPSDPHFLTLEADQETLYLWDDGKGTLYGFLPSFAKDGNVRPVVHSGKVFLDGEQLNADTILETNRTYQLEHRTLLHRDCANLILLPSENVPSMHIRTGSGSMLKIHKNKEKKESIQMAFYSPDGQEIYRSKGRSDQIRGRGNSTWDPSIPKKPYNLYLDSNADLLGTGSASKWVLLANVMDKSDLRNWVVFRLAQETSAQWMPQAEPVELYLNGEYAGVYLLTDKVEASPNRVTLGKSDVLFNLELQDRAKDYAIPELTSSSSAEIVFPNKLSASRLTDIDTQLRRIFDGIADHSLTEAELEDCLDLDSWAWLYLIQEISENYDSASCSLYFYLQDGKLYAGPIWDYDLTFGVMPMYSPEYLYARYKEVAPLWGQLWQYDRFRECCIAQYRDRFRPVLDHLMTQELPQKADSIHAASERGMLRWDYYDDFVEDKYSRSSVEDLQRFANRRITYLDQVWLQGVCFHNVDIRAYGYGFDKFYTSVEDGTCFTGIAEIESFYGDSFHWIDKESGADFDFSQPITKDTSIRSLEVPEEGEEEEASYSFRERFGSFFPQLIALVSCGLLILCLIILFQKDRHMHPRKRI